MSRALIVKLEPSYEMCVQVQLIESLGEFGLVGNAMQAKSGTRQTRLN
jgi:hypothetical protein